jgi:hypothetical protein
MLAVVVEGCAGRMEAETKHKTQTSKLTWYLIVAQEGIDS